MNTVASTWSNTRLPVPSSAAGGTACSASVRSSTRRAHGCARSHATSDGRRSKARFGHFIGYRARAPRQRLNQLFGKTEGKGQRQLKCAHERPCSHAPASGVPCFAACAKSRTRTPARVSAAYSAACSASTAARTLSRAAASLVSIKALSCAACALLSKAVGATMSTWLQLCGAAECACVAPSRSSTTRSAKPLHPSRLRQSRISGRSESSARRTAARGRWAAARRAPSAQARRVQAASTRQPRRRAPGRARKAARARPRRGRAAAAAPPLAAAACRLRQRRRAEAPRAAVRPAPAQQAARRRRQLRRPPRTAGQGRETRLAAPPCAGTASLECALYRLEWEGRTRLSAAVGRLSALISGPIPPSLSVHRWRLSAAVGPDSRQASAGRREAVGRLKRLSRLSARSRCHVAAARARRCLRAP
jgi:hypothetical protein